MRNRYILLPMLIILAGCGSIATEHYTKVSPLTEEEKITFSCDRLAREENNLVALLNDIGEVKTSDQVVANLGIATALLRASLGGFNTQDLSHRANVQEKTEAIELARLRLNEVKELRSSKKCLASDGQHSEGNPPLFGAM